MQSKSFYLKPLAAMIAVAFLGAYHAEAQTASDLGTVQTNATAANATVQAKKSFESKVYTRRQLQKSTQPVKTVTKQEQDLLGPDASGMQALSILPNVKISSYNASSASSRSTLSMRGMKVGNNSIPGDLATNAISMELDGVPLNSLIQSTGWHSPEVPIGALLQGINVIQGPGNPRERWYDSLGGTVNFIPMQPTQHPGTKVNLSLGSFGTNVVSVVHNTGSHDGWSTVLGVARAGSQSIRSTGDSMPSKTLQAYVKTRKTLENGSLSFGAYAEQNDEQRPNMIPVSAADAQANQIDVNGLGAGGPLYSEQTSGYYSTLPRSVWQKDIQLQTYMGWGRLHLQLSPDLSLSNMFWIRNGNVQHYRQNYYLPGSPGGEYYIEHSNTYGDKLNFDQRINGWNKLSYGGYLINSRSTNDYIGYTPNASIGLQGNGITAASITGLGANTTTNTFWALYAQDKIKPIPSLVIVPGIRMVGFQTDFSNTTVAQANSFFPGQGTTVNASIGDPALDGSTNFVKTEPSIGANWALNPDLSLFASYAVALHNPRQGNYDRSAVDLAALKLVKSQNFDIGMRWNQRHTLGMENVYASLDYFQTKLSNQTIHYSPANTNTVYSTEFGVGNATIKGIDLQLRADANQHWKGFANLGFFRSNWDSYYSYNTNTSFNGYPVSNSPDVTANAGITYRYYMPSGVVDTTLWDQYTGSFYLFNNQVAGPSRQQNPAYNLVNLTVKAETTALHSVLVGTKLTTLSLSVLNLFDKQYNSTAYISSGGYFQTPNGGYVIANQGAPRAIYLSLSADF